MLELRQSAFVRDLLASEGLSRRRGQEVDRGFGLESLLDLCVNFVSASLDLNIASRARQNLVVVGLEPRQELILLHDARARLLCLALYRVLELGLCVHSDSAAAHLVRHQHSMRLLVDSDQPGLF